MNGIYNDANFRRHVRQHKTVHIISLGFEQRCLSYPKFVTELKLDAGKHKFICIQPSDENMSDFLRSCRDQNRQAMINTISGVRFMTLTEILEELKAEEPPNNVSVDISSMPRSNIFQVLDTILAKFGQKTRLFCIYSYPKTYMYGPLQEPAPTVDYIDHRPRVSRTDRPTVIFLPGFDIEYTNVALTHLHALTDSQLDAHWLIPFPGNKYYLYERSLECHLGLIGKDPVKLFPQSSLKMGYRILLDQIRSTGDRPVFVVPLGPRVICIPLLLAIRHFRTISKSVNVLLPRTRNYNSLRSEGYEEPDVEEIFLDSSGDE